VTAFFDTNVLVYAASSDARKEIADRALRHGGVISVQVVNEFTSVARRKMRMDWPHIDEAVARMRDMFELILPLTLDNHAAALALARDHNLPFYDALILAAAIEAGCETLYSEDFQHGRRFGECTIVNPFIEGPRH
jgi:predicted nucleic acid-binding protein